jgi:hypothetical protein
MPGWLGDEKQEHYHHRTPIEKNMTMRRPT